MQHAQKIGEVRPCGFRVMQADRQTSKQTYSSQYFAPLYGSTAHLVYSSAAMEHDKHNASCAGLQHTIVWWTFAFIMEGLGIGLYVSIHLKVTSLHICHPVCRLKNF